VTAGGIEALASIPEFDARLEVGDMAERTAYDPGTPCWVDLGSPDPQATAAFYGDLFGWTGNVDPRPEAGGYGMFTLRGKNVAGFGPQTDTSMPPFWAVYVSVASADETLQRATEAGGTVVAGPFDVFDAGRMGVVRDAVGTFVSVWQPNQHIGAELVNEPGTFAWSELATTDVAAARSFYQAVFGWGVNQEASSESSAIFTVGDRIVCGAHTAGEGEFPSWSVWFAVEDTDASAARAAERGAKTLMPPTDMDFGRGAMIADPQGAVFGIGTMNAGAQATA
jgi:predicted enzyme related to lactoylglutathione lyase